MASSAVSAFGTLLKIGDGGGPETFTTIGEVSALKGPSFKVTVQDVTAHDTGPYKQKITTLVDPGQITFDINFNNLATQGFSGGLYNDMVNRTKRNFQLVLPTTVNKTGSFAALITDWSFDMPVDGALKASITLELTSAITWA